MKKQDKQETTEPTQIDRPISPKPLSFRVRSLQALRRLAERVLRDKAAPVSKIDKVQSPEEPQRIIQELQIHQIELEVQNEELRRNQEELELLHARYFDLYDLAPVGYCTIDTKGFIQEVNFTAAYLLKVARKDLQKRPISHFIFRDDQDIYYLSRKQLLETRRAQCCELRMNRSNGTIFWAHLETTITRDEKGEIMHRLVLSDISSRKENEAALLQLHRQNQEILDSITDAFISLTDDLIVSYFNAAAERMLHKKRSDVIGRKLFEVFPEGEGTIIEDKYKEVLRTKAPLSFEVEFAVPAYQGWYDIRVYPSPDGITVYIQVITERKNAEREKARLEAISQQLQKTESLGRMAGAIAHHFNNKLNVVTGYLEYTIASLPHGDTARDNLAIALEEAEKAVEISKMMHTYLGQVVAKMEPLDISEICQKFMPLIEATMPKNTHLKVNVQSPGPVVVVNAVQIQQVLTNMLTNAWEAMEDGQGTIHLTVETVCSTDIPSLGRYPLDWLPSERSYVCLEIKDNGCGIAEKDIKELFSPFFSRKFTGRGLGLPVALGLIKAHDGAITVESSATMGSVFRIFLPIPDDY